jgi:O-antigen ligase
MMRVSAAHPDTMTGAAAATLPTVLVVAGLVNAAAAASVLRLTEASRDVVAAASLGICVLVCIGLVRASGRSGARASLSSRSGKTLAIFVSGYLFTTFLVHLLGERADAGAMWLQLVMALLPASLFIGYFTITNSTPVGNGIDLACVVLFVLAALSIGLEFTGLYRVEAYGERYFGFLGDGVAWLLSFVAVVFMSRGRYGLLALCLGLLVLTQSRGALFIFMAGGGLLLFTARGDNSQKQRVAALLLLVGGGIGYLLYEDRILSVFDRYSSVELADNDRTATINLSLTLFERSPVFGLGYNAQPTFFGREYLDATAIQGFSTPVSTAFQVLADGGLIAGFGYCLFVIVVTALCFSILSQISSDREALVLRGLAAWLVAFLLANHSAAWLLPGSYLAPIVFATAGVLAGRRARMHVQHPEPLHRRAVRPVPPRFKRNSA